MDKKSQISFDKSCEAFDKFVDKNADNPKYKDRFVVFVDGKYEAIGDSKINLIENVYVKYGNVPMCAGRITKSLDVTIIEGMETPP